MLKDFNNWSIHKIMLFVFSAAIITVAIMLLYMHRYYESIKCNEKHIVQPAATIGSIVYLYDRPVIIVDTITIKSVLMYKTGFLYLLHHGQEEEYMYIMPYTPATIFNNTPPLP